MITLLEKDIGDVSLLILSMTLNDIGSSGRDAAECPQKSTNPADNWPDCSFIHFSRVF